ncbi:TonB-dependent receptor plug domain-containing protein [Massilia sp. B-10]|nr:TonB-dependent receptor plug domain-containing protein [Massilia sp. B-10]
MNHPFRLNAVASLFAASLSPFAIAADAPPPLVDVVVVSGSRVEHASFDLPAAIDVVDASRMRDNQMRVNASEALAAVPGLVAQNRQNYAQDLQISSRGFGAPLRLRRARCAPDRRRHSSHHAGRPGPGRHLQSGRGRTHGSAARAFSAIYGNHSGGTVALFTREGKGKPVLEASIMRAATARARRT